MYSYVIPVLAIILILAALYMLFFAAFKNISPAQVTIIIDADVREGVEQQVLTAKRVADRYFTNASVYVRGGDDDYVDILCRSYRIEKWT
ncbi:MAG: hypothetical protein IJT38_05410 [Clostridia bacterium]|nr:hypothetical protein [Clostridia bacterium]